MSVGRRQVLMGGLGLGLAAAAGPRLTASREETDAPQAFSTYGIVPGGGEIDQTATLQLAADDAAETGTPLFLPAGIYSTSRLSSNRVPRSRACRDDRSSTIATVARS
jgi:hypothetical protein